MRDRSFRIEQRELKIKKRQRMIKSVAHPSDFVDLMPNNKHNNKIVSALGDKAGLLDKHDYGAITSGVSVKTNTRKGKASYKHKGAYGSANNYSRHDERQIEKFKELGKGHL